MVSKNNALATRENYSLATLNQEAMQAMAEELDGLGAVPFDQIKVPSGGGLAFEIPGDDPDRPETVDELVGVIAVHHPVNAYWKAAFSGGNEQPDCSSLDGKTGMETETGEVRKCDGCPFNVFGSANDGTNSKACKNGHRIYLLRNGEPLPVLLSLPPTSLKAFRDYLAKRVVLKGKRCYAVITRITLSKAKSSGGITYSTCNFSKVGDLTPQEIEALQPTIEWVTEAARKIPASTSDAGQHTSSDKFIDIENDDEPPFPQE